MVEGGQLLGDIQTTIDQLLLLKNLWFIEPLGGPETAILQPMGAGVVRASFSIRFRMDLGSREPSFYDGYYNYRY